MQTFRTAITFLILCIALWGCADRGESPTSPEEPLPEEETDPPAQVMGINVNGQYNLMKFDNIDRSGTTWVRGFLDFFQLYPDNTALENDERVRQYLELKERGYKTILSIKWNFSDRSFPEPGSDEMENYKSYLRNLLTEVWQHTDIIVAGNEPFIESKTDERGNKLVTFYREIAVEIRDFRENNDRDVPIFIGAFNNLYLSGWRTAGVNDLLAFSDKTEWIEGVDVHIHHSAIEQINDFLDYVNVRIRPDQKMLVSEFSLKDHFRTKMDETIPEAFASEYNLDPETRNYQYLDSALKENVPREEWVDFLSSSYWFENRKRYLWNAYQRFKSYDKFHIANYALRQSFPFNRDFTANDTPWILNGLFANRTVRPDPETELDRFNYAWIEDFRKILKDSENSN